MTFKKMSEVQVTCAGFSTGPEKTSLGGDIETSELIPPDSMFLLERVSKLFIQTG